MAAVRRVHLRWALCIALIALATHVHVLWGNWVRDDFALILGNPSIRRLSAIPEQLSQPFLGIFWRPSVTIGYTLEYAIWGLHPVGYHATNLALHVCCAVLVYAIWQRLSVHAWLPVGAGLLFAVHGAHYQPAVIADRTGLLAATGSLLAWWCVWRRTESVAGAVGRELWTGAAILAYAVALGAKEEAVVLPVMICAGYLLRRRWANEQDAPRVPWQVLGVLTAVAGLYWLARGQILQSKGLLASTVPGLAHRIVSAPVWIVHQWRDVVLPFWLDVDYRGLVWPHVATAQVTLAWVAVVAVSLLAWKARQRRPELLMGLVLAGFAWLPTSNLVPIYPETATRHVFMPPHLLYFPNTMLLGAVAAGGVAIVEAFGSIGAAVVLVFVLAQVVSTVRMNYVWMDDVRLYRYVLHMHPQHPLMWRNLGLALATRGETQSAVAAYEASIRAKPTAEAYIGLAEIEQHREELQAAAAAYRAAKALAPTKAEPYLGLAHVLSTGGEMEAARSLLEEGLDHGVDPPRLLEALARIERDSGHFSAAQTAIERALQLAPEAPTLWNTLGTIRAAAGDPRGARTAWTRAESLAPGMTPAAENLQALGAER